MTNVLPIPTRFKTSAANKKPSVASQMHHKSTHHKHRDLSSSLFEPGDMLLSVIDSKLHGSVESLSGRSSLDVFKELPLPYDVIVRRPEILEFFAYENRSDVKSPNCEHIYKLPCPEDPDSQVLVREADLPDDLRRRKGRKQQKEMAKAHLEDVAEMGISSVGLASMSPFGLKRSQNSYVSEDDSGRAAKLKRAGAFHTGQHQHKLPAVDIMESFYAVIIGQKDAEDFEEEKNDEARTSKEEQDNQAVEHIEELIGNLQLHHEDTQDLIKQRKGEQDQTIEDMLGLWGKKDEFRNLFGLPDEDEYLGIQTIPQLPAGNSYDEKELEDLLGIPAPVKHRRVAPPASLRQQAQSTIREDDPGAWPNTPSGLWNTGASSGTASSGLWSTGASSGRA